MQKQQGNSLLEILMVLAVSSVLIILAVRYFMVVDFNMRVARAISQIDIITRASYQWLEYERKANFKDIGVTSLEDTGLISENDLKTAWGKIEVKPGSNNNHVKIIVPTTLSGCRSLSHHLNSIAYTEINENECNGGSYFGEF